MERFGYFWPTIRRALEYSRCPFRAEKRYVHPNLIGKQKEQEKLSEDKKLCLDVFELFVFFSSL